MSDVRKIEQALRRALKWAGADIRESDGVYVAALYDHDTPSQNGGVASVEINVSRLARDVERELS
jgi:hypothetical protein